MFRVEYHTLPLQALGRATRKIRRLQPHLGRVQRYLVLGNSFQFLSTKATANAGAATTTKSYAAPISEPWEFRPPTGPHARTNASSYDTLRER